MSSENQPTDPGKGRINLNYLKFKTRYTIALRVMPLVIMLAALKIASHYFGFEIIELNALFTSLVAGTIFLIGFLISGVLSDYKESEKLPSEIAGCLTNMMDDTFTILKSKNSVNALRLMNHHYVLLQDLVDWLYKRKDLNYLLGKINRINDFLIELDKEGVQPNYLIKLKNEQHTLRKMILRIDTIRETEFVSSGYAIVEVMGFLIALSLVFIKINPFYASLFLTLIVTFLIMYMFLLVKDLDNPFDYSAFGETGSEISLAPIHNLHILYKDYDLTLS